MIQGLAVASVGGLLSQLAGGDFATGFVTAGVAFALNHNLTAQKGNGLGFGERVGRFFDRIGDGFREIGNSFGWHASAKFGVGAGVRFGGTRLGFDLSYETSGLGADSEVSPTV